MCVCNEGNGDVAKQHHLVVGFVVVDIVVFVVIATIVTMTIVVLLIPMSRRRRFYRGRGGRGRLRVFVVVGRPPFVLLLSFVLLVLGCRSCCSS